VIGNLETKWSQKNVIVPETGAVAAKQSQKNAVVED
jgi:hypothetical protein